MQETKALLSRWRGNLGVVLERRPQCAVSHDAYRFLKRQVRWSGIPIIFRIFHSLLWSTVKGFGIVNKAEIDIFVELSCFFDDPADVGNLISGSSAFSKTSLNIWKFTVHVLLKLGLENFEHYSVWDECNCEVVWAFFGIAFLCTSQPRAKGAPHLGICSSTEMTFIDHLLGAGLWGLCKCCSSSSKQPDHVSIMPTLYKGRK